MSEDLLVTLGVKDKGANAQIKALNKEIRYLDKEFKTVTNSSKTYENGTASLQKQQELLNQKLQAVGAKMSAYKTQMQQATEGIEKKKARLEELNNTEGDNEKAIEQVTNQLNKYEQQLRDAERDIKLTENELQQLSRSLLEVQGNLQTKKIQDFANKLKEMSEKMEATAERFRSFGDLADSAGNKLMGAGTSILAIAGYASKLSMDFETATASINTLLDDTTNLDGYKEKMLSLSNDLNLSLDTMASGMYQAISSLGDGGAETERIFATMAKSAKGGGAEVSDSVALIASAMKGYGSINDETAQKISDLAFETAKLGVTTFPEMARSMQPLFPLASTLNVSLEELFGVMATGTGVVGNTSEVSTQLKAVFSNLIKPTTEMAKVMEKYGYANGQAMIKAEGFSGVLKILQKETGGQSDKMGKLFSSTEALTLVTALTGEQYSTFVEKTGKLNNAMGATDRALEKVTNTTEERLNKSINKLKNSFVNLGGSVSPSIDKISKCVEKLSEYIGKMDEETFENIIKIGTWTLALGAGTKALGGFSKSIGNTIDLFSKVTSGTSKLITKFAEASKETGLLDNSIKKVGLKAFTTNLANTTSKMGGGVGMVGKFTSGLLSLNPVTIGITAAVGALATGVAVYKTNQELANSSCIRAKEDLSLFEKVVATFTGKTFESTEALKEKGLVLDELSESFSTEFKNAVDDATKGSQDFSIALREINLDGVFSNEESAALNERVNNLVDTTIATINSRKEEQQQGLKHLFAVDGTLSENETLILQHFEKMATTSIKEVEQLRNDINTIKQRALEDGRILNEQEISDIQTKEQRIREIQLQNVATTNEELTFARNDFRNRVATMDAEAASEYLEKQRAYADEQILQKAAIYDTQIELLQGNLNNMDEVTRAAAEQEILNLQESKRNEIATWEQYFADCLGIAVAENENLAGIIDTSNGKILTEQGAKCAEMLNTHSSYYKDLDSITTTGLYKLYNENDQTFRDVLVNVDSTTGKIIGTYDTYSGEMGGLNEEIAKDTKNMVLDFENAQRDMQAQIESTTSDFKVSGSDIKNANNEVVGSLESVTKETDGTYKAILNINGQKMEIKTNAATTKNEINDVATAINNLPTSKSIWVNVNKNSSVVSGGAIPKRMAVPESTYNQGGAIPDIATARAIPSEFSTMELNPSFYSAKNPIIEAVAKTVTKEAPKPTNSNINYKEIADIIAKAIGDEISKLKIEPVINNLLNGQEITSTVSNNMAWNSRRIR